VRSRAGAATLIVLGAGVLGAIQPKLNASLSERLGAAVLASLVNFAAAFVGALAVLVVRPGTRRRLQDVRDWPVPWWTFTAGLGGVLVVVAGAVAVETIGVAVFSVAFFGGQITAGLLVDRLGVGAGGPRPIVAGRVAAAAVAIAAVVVAQLGRPVGEVAPALVLLVVAAGAASAFQSAFNGRIAHAVDDPFAPTTVNVTIGLVALVLLVGAVAAAGGLDRPSWPTAEPWLYAGGFLGVAIVLSLAIASAALGVLRATLSMLAAQLTAAFVVDAVLDGEAPTPGVLAGSALIVVAVVLVGRSR
jgi:bacterial/archaeal transporter family-2 protein